MNDRKTEFEQLLEQSRELAEKALSSSTKTAYAIDFGIFVDWAHDLGVGSLPATVETVRAYVAACKQRGIAVSTLSRYLTSISQAHKLAGQFNPVADPEVRKAVKGYVVEKGLAQRRAKPILFEQLVRMVEHLGSSIKGLRDAAIITIGWMAALRRSEIAALRREDIESVTEGLIVHIRRSKTDREGKGRSIGIPFGSDRFCPVAVIRRWYTVAQITSGPLFFGTFRGADKKMFLTLKRRNRSISDRTIAEIVKKALENAGYDSEGYSGHSLRAGFCTQAAKCGVPDTLIMNHTRHRSHKTLEGYVRDGNLFLSNPLSVVLGRALETVPEVPFLPESAGFEEKSEVDLSPLAANPAVSSLEADE